MSRFSSFLLLYLISFSNLLPNPTSSFMFLKSARSFECILFFLLLLTPTSYFMFLKSFLSWSCIFPLSVELELSDESSHYFYYGESFLISILFVLSLAARIFTSCFSTIFPPSWMLCFVIISRSFILSVLKWISD